MRQLVFNYFRGNTDLLIKNGPGHCSKAMTCHFVLCVISHASQSGIYRSIAHRPAIATCPGKDKLGMTTKGEGYVAFVEFLWTIFWWAVLGSNQWLPPCEGGTLPLS